MRLDVFLADNRYAASRTEAKAFITAGAVTVDGRVVTKPSFDVDLDAQISVNRESKPYVSRGGLKLHAALSEFRISALNAAALDIGASSGGFTDCLLKHGASHVIAVDSGSGQMSEQLRADGRVTVVENFNARYMKRDDFEYVPTLAVMDVSFISATLIIPAVYEILAGGGDFVCLVKPQFEVGRGGLGKGGIVKDKKKRDEALVRVIDFAQACGFVCLGKMTSPIEGGDGNVEFLIHLRKRGVANEEGSNNS